ncbi:MAG: carbohydrate ABC transporter permease [Acidimicrobiia bacterium]
MIRNSLRVGILSLVALFTVGVPLWMVVVNSFKTQTDAAGLGLGLPETWNAAANYREVIDASRYGLGLGNSLLVTVVSLGILLALGAPASWAFARSTSRWMRIFYTVSVFGVVLPPAVVPTVFLMRMIELQGTRTALILYTIGSRIALVVFLLTGFCKGLPRELEEAAAVDGASRLRVFRSVVLPIMGPVVAATTIILVVLIWNDFYGPIFLLTGEGRATLPLGLYRLSSGINQANAWNLVFAHVVLVSLPLIITYLLAQRKILEGVTAGAVRG